MPLDVANPEISVVAHADHEAGSPHAAHDTASMHEHASTPDCPHCATQADDSQSTPTICVADSTSNANGSKATGTPDLFKLFTQARLATPVWTAAAPPLILTAASSVVPHVERTPLNVRHCVFLI
jgi:hypothetical protein